MRTARSIGVTKILPSPIVPVCAAARIASTTALDALVGDGDFEPRLGHEVHDVFGAAINLGMALLPAVSLDLGDGHAVRAEPVERLAHVVELERFDDGGDDLHGLLFVPFEQRGVGAGFCGLARAELADDEIFITMHGNRADENHRLRLFKANFVAPPF